MIAGNVNAESTASSTGRGGGGVCGGTHYNALIAGNISGSQVSGAAHATLYNCTVVGNIGTNSASDSVIGGYTTTQSCLVNTIIWGNVCDVGSLYDNVYFPPVTDGNHYNAPNQFCKNNYTYPVITGGTANIGSADDPGFVNAAKGDYRLRQNSPCVNAGMFDASWMTGATDLADLRGTFGRIAFADGAGEVVLNSIDTDGVKGGFDLEMLAAEADKIWNDEMESVNLDEVYRLGGSSGGARPKAHITNENEEWIVKFPCLIDPSDIGTREFEANRLAEQCGINVNQYKLFPSSVCKGYFGAKRFDRTLDEDEIYERSLR